MFRSHPAGASQTTRAELPASWSTFSLPEAKKPIDFPSGDQNGRAAISGGRPTSARHWYQEAGARWRGVPARLCPGGEDDVATVGGDCRRLIQDLPLVGKIDNHARQQRGRPGVAAQTEARPQRSRIAGLVAATPAQAIAWRRGRRVIAGSRTVERAASLQNKKGGGGGGAPSRKSAGPSASTGTSSR